MRGGIPDDSAGDTAGGAAASPLARLLAAASLKGQRRNHPARLTHPYAGREISDGVFCEAAYGQNVSPLRFGLEDFGDTKLADLVEFLRDLFLKNGGARLMIYFLSCRRQALR